MVDVLTAAQRRLNMSRIRGKNSKPEMVVRRLLHALGYRYRLHRRDLPGCPDIVLPSRRKIVEVRGCYWHMHTCRFGRVTPQTNSAFWSEKRSATVQRDRRNLAALRHLGWRVLVVWECQVKDPQLPERLEEFLD